MNIGIHIFQQPMQTTQPMTRKMPATGYAATEIIFRPGNESGENLLKRWM
jgi:hypothetical protein